LDLVHSEKRERRQSFVVALAVAVGLSVLLAPVVEAAVTKVKGTVTAKVKDTNGDGIESEVIEDAGAPAPTGGSTGALAVRTFAGGNQFLGAADCDPPGTGGPTDIFGDTLTVPGGHHVTAVIVTGTASVQVRAQAVGSGNIPLLTLAATADNPVVTLALDNGLELTDNLILQCTSGSGQFAAIGQDISND
jgi:hypothetical protein